MSTTFLTPPADHTHRAREIVTQLQKSELFREYQKAFEATTGLPLGIRAADSFQPPLHDSKLVNPFCALMAATNKSCAACLQLQEKLAQNASAEACTVQCYAGLTESAVPIRVGENVLGYLQTGQVLLQKPAQSRFRRVAEDLAFDQQANAAELKAAYFQTRVLPKKQYDAVVRLLSIFAAYLSSRSNQLVTQEASAEAPVITRARTYIAEHFSEEIALTDVAKAVNTSPFYFCKLFKTATGLTFTDYLARVRVETVKQILLNPHKRVSEAAYEAGFQSLSQFNRVFRRIAGESPSTYRERLHGPGTGTMANAA
ncbi:MAG TPA: PocR ligand-binding domain-containing protein [Opitutaceae bacterium]|nr:PocR ligand-binding domain-containing protein [Opitutaceae bacterium]